MRFPSAPGGVASVTLCVRSLADTAPFWRAVLRPLGYGRTGAWLGGVLWAREGAQILLIEAPEPASGVELVLRASSREQVDAIHAEAAVWGWPVPEPPAPMPHAPGLYGCVLLVPGAEGIRIGIAHAWDDLPERGDAELVRLPGVDPEVRLGGYLFRPERPSAAAVLVLHGYGGDATLTAGLGARLAARGLTTLCLSQRGWLGSTGAEDQGLRQPDDALLAADWLRKEAGAAHVGLLGFSQGAQVALLAAARSHPRPPEAVVAFFPCTDLHTWPQAVEGKAVASYLEDFVRPEDLDRCSPARVAHRITAPTLLVHGDADRLSPLSQSEAMVAANPALRLHVVPGADHGLGTWFDAAWETAMAFLEAHLGD